MPIRSPHTARNITARPVEVGATEAILAGLPDTDSLIELPGPTSTRAFAREWLLDVAQDINLAVEEVGEERFYWEHSTLETTFSRPLELKTEEAVLMIAAQLPATAWQGSLPTHSGDAALAAQSSGAYLEAITRRVLLAIRHLMWECAAELIGDGILTWNGRWLVWHEDEVHVPWRPEGVQ